jgi:GTP pyrophosphokinase
VEAWDRVGLIGDITSVVSSEKINIAAFWLDKPSEDKREVRFTLDVQSIGQLARLFSKLEGVTGVINVSRSSED